MNIKHIMALLVMTSFGKVSAARPLLPSSGQSLATHKSGKTCSVAQVEADALKQAKSLIRLYEASTSSDDKECLERAMRDLLQKVTEQSAIFGKAMEAEAVGGELEASIVNEQEQVNLNNVIQVLQQKLDTVSPSQQYTQTKRKRATK